MTMAALAPAQVDTLSSMCAVVPTDQWVLIGASALLCHDVPLRRMTMDVDFAVSGSALAVGARLIDAGWQRDDRIQQRWHRLGTQIDLIAATQEEVNAGEVRLSDDFVLSVVGFDLAFNETVSVEVAPGVAVRVPRLSVLVLLKMISWLDRHDRTKDLGDIILMFDEALDDVDDIRFEPTHPVGASGLDHDDQGPFLLGWDLGIRSAAPHVHWVKRFLERMADRDSVAFAQLVRASEYGYGAEDRVSARLHAFQLGLEQGSSEAEAKRSQRGSSVASPHEFVGPRPRVGGRPSSPSAGHVVRRSNEQMIHDAIDNRTVLTFSYDGLDRVVEPHVLGIKSGRLQVLTRQTGGHSSSGPLPGWRRFDLDRIAELKATSRHFDGARSSYGRPSPFDRQIAVVR